MIEVLAKGGHNCLNCEWYQSREQIAPTAVPTKEQEPTLTIKSRRQQWPHLYIFIDLYRMIQHGDSIWGVTTYHCLSRSLVKMWGLEDATGL